MALTGRTGQQISEYGIMLGTIILGVVVMQHHFTASIAGGLRGATARMLGTTYPDDSGSSGTSSRSTLSQVGTPGRAQVRGSSSSSGSSSSGFLMAQPYGPYLGIFVTYKDMQGDPSPSYDSIGLQLPELHGRAGYKLGPKRFRVTSNKSNRGRGRLEARLDTNGSEEGGEQMALGVTDEWIEWNADIDQMGSIGAVATILSLEEAWPSADEESTTPTGTTLPPNLQAEQDAKQRQKHDRAVAARQNGRRAAQDLIKLLFGEDFDAEGELEKFGDTWSPNGVSTRFERKTLGELRDLRRRAKDDLETLVASAKEAGIDPDMISALTGEPPEGSLEGGATHIRRPALSQEDYERWNGRTPPPQVSQDLGGELLDLDGDGLADLASAGPNKFRPIRWLVVERQTEEDVQRGIQKERAVDAYIHAGSMPNFSPQGELEEQRRDTYRSSTYEARQRREHDRLPNAQVKKFEIPEFHDDGLTMEESQAAGHAPAAWLKNPKPMKVIDDKGKVVEDSTPGGPLVTPRAWIRINPEAVPPNATPLFESEDDLHGNHTVTGLNAVEPLTPTGEPRFAPSASHPGDQVPGN